MPPEDNAPAPAPVDAPAPNDNTPAPAPAPEPAADGLPANDPTGEGVTNDEIAAALGRPELADKPDDKPAPAADDENEEVTPPADDPSNPTPAATPPAEVPPMPVNPDDPNKPAPLEPEKPAPQPTEENGYPKELADLQVEDAEGKTFKISSVDDLPEDFDPKNNRQIMEIIRDTEKLAKDRADYDAEKATNEASVARDEKIVAIQKGWDGEVEQLQAEKRLDTDPAKAQGRINQVYEHMGEVNAERIKNNRPTLTSFEDALNSLERKEANTQAAADKQDEKADARKRGALVGGSSTAANTGTAPVYKPGSARTAIDAVRTMGLVK